MPLDTPIAFIIFNRADTTALVFAEIRKAQPKTLLVIADGPRTPEEAEKCRDTQAVVDGVDWDCEVLTNYSDINLGCGPRVSSGISWVFENVEEAIILEDDCLPDPSFFPFCEQMLAEYRDDERVVHITGTNALPNENLEASYLFNRLTSIWGWATWRRAWQNYDYTMKGWPEYKKTKDLDFYGKQKINVSSILSGHWEEPVNTWDYQWWFACIKNQGISITPKVNLIKNIGFRPDATHTFEPSKVSAVPVSCLYFPLIAPKDQTLNPKFDEKSLEYTWGKPPTPFTKLGVMIRKLKSKIQIRARIGSLTQRFRKP